MQLPIHMMIHLIIKDRLSALFINRATHPNGIQVRKVCLYDVNILIWGSVRNDLKIPRSWLIPHKREDEGFRPFRKLLHEA